MTTMQKNEYYFERSPNTEYAIDAEFKIDLINDILGLKNVFG